MKSNVLRLSCNFMASAFTVPRWLRFSDTLALQTNKDMHNFSISTGPSASALPVLRYWQAFRVSPMKPCFIPMPGPRFWIFIGLLEHTEKITRTAEIVSWDPATPSVRDATGASFGLSPQAGFTPAMQNWYRRQANLMAAGAYNHTTEMLVFLNQHALDESGASTKFQREAVA